MSGVLQLDLEFVLKTIAFLCGGFGAADTVVTSESSFGHCSARIVKARGWRLMSFLTRMVLHRGHRRPLQLSTTVALRTPSRCVDPKVTPCADIVVDVAATGCFTDRQTTIMIRNLLVGGGNDKETSTLICRGLGQITFHNSLVRERMGYNGTVRGGSQGDVGRMYAIGTRVMLDGETIVPYKANASVPVKLLRNVVISMCRIAQSYFPEVLSVIRDVEGDTGLQPVSPMDGAPPRGGSPRQEGRRHCVGYSIDMSCDLGNSSHYDVHDASQGSGKKGRRHRVGYSIDMSCDLGNSSHYDGCS